MSMTPHIRAGMAAETILPDFHIRYGSTRSVLPEQEEAAFSGAECSYKHIVASMAAAGVTKEV